MFGEATKHLFLKYLSYMTKTTQEESWVSQTKESPEIKRTVGQRWEKNVCKHRRRRSLSSSLVLSSGCTVPKPVPRSLRAPLPTVQLNTRFTLHEIRKWRRGPAGEITPPDSKVVVYCIIVGRPTERRQSCNWRPELQRTTMLQGEMESEKSKVRGDVWKTNSIPV